MSIKQISEARLGEELRGESRGILDFLVRFAVPAASQAVAKPLTRNRRLVVVGGEPNSVLCVAERSLRCSVANCS